MHVDGPLVAEPTVPPDAVQELPTGESEPAVLGEVGEQVELAGGERDHLAGTSCLTPSGIDLNGPERGDRRGQTGWGRRPAQDRVDTCDQLAGEKGLVT